MERNGNANDNEVFRFCRVQERQDHVFNRFILAGLTLIVMTYLAWRWA